MGIRDASLNEMEAELLRAEDEYQTIDHARQKPVGKHRNNGTLMQRGYEAARKRRDFIETEVWRLQALKLAREMETNDAA